MYLRNSLNIFSYNFVKYKTNGNYVLINSRFWSVYYYINICICTSKNAFLKSKCVFYIVFYPVSMLHVCTHFNFETLKFLNIFKNNK